MLQQASPVRHSAVKNTFMPRFIQMPTMNIFRINRTGQGKKDIGQKSNEQLVPDISSVNELDETLDKSIYPADYDDQQKTILDNGLQSPEIYNRAARNKTSSHSSDEFNSKQYEMKIPDETKPQDEFGFSGIPRHQCYSDTENRMRGTAKLPGFDIKKTMNFKKKFKTKTLQERKLKKMFVQTLSSADRMFTLSNDCQSKENAALHILTSESSVSNQTNNCNCVSVMASPTPKILPKTTKEISSYLPRKGQRLVQVHFDLQSTLKQCSVESLLELFVKTESKLLLAKHMEMFSVNTNEHIPATADGYNNATTSLDNSNKTLRKLNGEEHSVVPINLTSGFYKSLTMSDNHGISKSAQWNTAAIQTVPFTSRFCDDTCRIIPFSSENVGSSAIYSSESGLAAAEFSCSNKPDDNQSYNFTSLMLAICTVNTQVPKHQNENAVKLSVIEDHLVPDFHDETIGFLDDTATERGQPYSKIVDTEKNDQTISTVNAEERQISSVENNWLTAISRNTQDNIQQLTQPKKSMEDVAVQTDIPGFQTAEAQSVKSEYETSNLTADDEDNCPDFKETSALTTEDNENCPNLENEVGVTNYTCSYEVDKPVNARIDYEQGYNEEVSSVSSETTGTTSVAKDRAITDEKSNEISCFLEGKLPLTSKSHEAHLKETKGSCRPFRLGLSRKQKVQHLHPYWKNTT